MEASCLSRCLRSNHRQPNRDAGTAAVRFKRFLPKCACLRSNSESSDETGTVQHPMTETSEFQRDLEQPPVHMGNEGDLGVIFSHSGSDRAPRDVVEKIQKCLPSKPEQGGPFMNFIDQMIPMLDEESTPAQRDDADGAMQPLGGLPISFAGADVDHGVVELLPEATVQDLVDAVAEAIGRPTTVSFGGQRLEDMSAALSELGICPETTVDIPPMNKIRVELQDIDFRTTLPLIGRVPLADRIFEVPYPGDVCPAAYLVDHLRDLLIRKFQVLMEKSQCSYSSEMIARKNSIVILPLPSTEMRGLHSALVPRDDLAWTTLQQVEWLNIQWQLNDLQKHHVGIDWQQLMEMASRDQSGRYRRSQDIRVYFKVLD